MYERTAQLLEAEVADELLALDAEAGECFAFNEVAASIWRHLEQPASKDALREKLLDEYDVSPDQCDKELTAFLEVLTQRGLIRAKQF
jgi:PqqD family protein of HPr-rel-A system